MTKTAALYQFFAGFGIPAYAATAVPDDAKLPYLTYTAPVSAFEEGPVSLTVNLWYRTTSEAVPNAKSEELSHAIGRGGVRLRCDGGYIWLLRGSPFSQPVSDTTDSAIKRRYINITAEYMTMN